MATASVVALGIWLAWGVCGFLTLNLVLWLAGRETAFDWLWRLL
jgi:hypothetical protein